MRLSALTLIGALAGGASLSQFPEYAQQYEQRLGGAVDALENVVTDFDRSARASGLSRDAALDELAGSAFLEARRADMTRTFARYDTLTRQLNALRLRGDVGRLILAPQLTDPEIARAAWSAYRPALPLTSAGAVTTVIGALLGGGLVALLRACLGHLRQRRATP